MDSDEEESELEHRTEPDGTTRAADEAAAGRSHGADRLATDEEEQAADEAYEESDLQRRQEVASHEKEMMELGATIKGEGEIE
jgi:hypothetical protein